MLVLAEVLQDGKLAQAAAQLQHVSCWPHLWQQARHGRSDGVGGQTAWEVRRRGRCGVGGAVWEVRCGRCGAARARPKLAASGAREQRRQDVTAPRASQRCVSCELARQAA